MPPIDRSNAARLTLLAQATAVLLAAGAVAVVSGVWPPREPPPPADAPTVDPLTGAPIGQVAGLTTTAPAQRAPARLDAEGIAARLALVANAPRRAETAPIDPDTTVAVDPTPDTTPPTASVADRITYLGRMTVGQAAFALLRVDDRQVVAQPGQAVRGLTDADAPVVLLTAGPQEALFRASGPEPLRVPLAAPATAALTVFEPTNPAGAGSGLASNAAQLGQRTNSPLLDAAQRLSVEERRRARTDAMWERRLSNLDQQVADGTMTPQQADDVRQRYAEYAERRERQPVTAEDAPE